MSWKDTITPIQENNSPEQSSSWKNSISKLPEDTTPSALESITRGGLQGISGGFSDEAMAGGAAGLQTIEDAIKSKIPEKESTIEHLVNQYKRYKGMAESDEAKAKAAHPYLYGGSELAGGFVPAGLAFKSVAGADLATKIATGAGLGAAATYGGLGQNEKDQAEKVAEGAALGGAGTLVGEKVISPLIKAGANKLVASLQDQPWANQLAATVKNKMAGGTLFGRAGAQDVEAQSAKLSSDVANALTGNVEGNIGEMGNAFTQGAEQRLKPNRDQLQVISDIKSKFGNYFNGAYDDDFDKLVKGQMSPKEANDFRKQLTSTISDLWQDNNVQTKPGSIKLAQYIKNSGIIPTLEDMSTNAGTDIGQLNSNISAAREPLDAFMQKTGSIVEDPNQQFKWSSSTPIEKQNLTVQNTVNKLLQQSGRSTDLGAKSANKLADLQSLLENAKKVSPSLGGEAPDFATNMAKKLQQQSFLNAAEQNVAGLRERKLEAVNPVTWATNAGINPYRAAELSTHVPGLKGIVSDVADKLLAPSPIERQAISQGLRSGQGTAHLADAYEQAIDSKNPGRINNVIFQILQNPMAKKAVGINTNPNSNTEEGQ